MKTKTYRIVKKVTSYSKKKGSHQKIIPIVKDLESKEAAIQYIKDNYPDAKLQDDNTYRISGFIAHSYLRIL